MKEEQLLKKLREAFKAEAEERLNNISSSLVQLEDVSSSPDKQKPILEVIFREAHSLKGASRAVNLVNIEIPARLMIKSLLAAWSCQSPGLEASASMMVIPSWVFL